MTHLEKLFAHCKLAPNIEKYCERQKKFEEKHPIVVQVGPFVPLIGGLLTTAGISWFGFIVFPALIWLIVGSMVLNTVVLVMWNALKKRATRKKLGYSFGLDDFPSKRQTHAILEKLLRLPATPQTQELKSQLWALADKNLLLQCWWNDVEKEIDALIASHERDVFKAKLLEPEKLETIAVEVEPTHPLAEPSHQRVVL